MVGVPRVACSPCSQFESNVSKLGQAHYKGRGQGRAGQGRAGQGRAGQGNLRIICGDAAEQMILLSNRAQTSCKPIHEDVSNLQHFTRVMQLT